MAARPGSDQETTLTKVCTKCNKTKPLDEFHRNKNSKDGRVCHCKPCVKVSSAVWAAANPERRKATDKAWSDANSERARATTKAWREANPERAKAASEAWREANPERYRKTRRRNHLKRYSITLEQFEDMLSAQDGGCGICAIDEPGGMGNFHVDHDHTCCSSDSACVKCLRGLLCHMCNLGVGALGDSVEGIIRAIDYLIRTAGIDLRTTAVVPSGYRSDASSGRRNLLKKYSMAPEQYDTILIMQDGRCACCGTDEPGRGETFFVDHDHITGFIRGLLCNRCNVGIGKLGDNLEGLTRALEYLQRAAAQQAAA